jgi:large subunit ribosomal protein L3
MVGLICKKAGMTQVFDEEGRLIPVTVMKIEPNVVIGKRTKEKNNYNALVLGAGNRKPKRMIKPVLGQFAKNIEPLMTIKEFKEFESEYKTKEPFKIGDKLGPEIFENIKYVDVRGTSKGKGYQGVMKRHGAGGGSKTHGSKFHRAQGSTGMAASPSRVFKGSKMAGHMGNKGATVQNLELIRVDKKNDVLLIKGCVPGARNSIVIVTKAKKRRVKEK